MTLEYAMHGKFSIKFDMFSFGLIILEIISRKKELLFLYIKLDGGSLELCEYSNLIYAHFSVLKSPKG